MTIETIQDVMEMWTYSNPSLRKALLIGFAELTEKGNAPPWMLFLADEFCFIELDRSELLRSEIDTQWLAMS